MEENLLKLTLSTLTHMTCLEGIEYMKRKEELRKIWFKPWLVRKLRKPGNFGRELTDDDDDSYEFFEYHRISKKNFEELYDLVAPIIDKRNTKLRRKVPAEQRLSITLRYLAKGDSPRSLEYQYRISHNLISKIIPEVCKAIYVALKSTYLKFPTSEEEWQEIASGFNTFWNFPNCLGAIDGKRFLLTKPPESSYIYHHGIIMLGIVDANYKFIYVDVGAQGHACGVGVWDKCTLRNYLEKNKLQIPPPCPLPYSNVSAPYVLVGDDAFPLKGYLMKPYQGQNLPSDRKIFNYRLQRCRRVATNAFGILQTRLQVFKQPLDTSPENVKLIILAGVVLHNFLLEHGKPLQPEFFQREDINEGIIVPGKYEEMPALGYEKLEAVTRRFPKDAKVVRENYTNYFMNAGQVPWQEKMALSH